MIARLVARVGAFRLQDRSRGTASGLVGRRGALARLERAHRDRGRLADGVDARLDHRRVGDSIRNRLGTEILEPVEERAHDRRGLDVLWPCASLPFTSVTSITVTGRSASAAESVIMPSRARPPCRRADSWSARSPLEAKM